MNVPRKLPRRFNACIAIFLVMGVLLLVAHRAARSGSNMTADRRIGVSRVDARLERQMRRCRRYPLMAARVMADALTSDDQETALAAASQLAWQVQLDQMSQDRHAAKFWQCLADQLRIRQPESLSPMAIIRTRETAIAMLSTTAARRDSSRDEVSWRIDSCLALLTCFQGPPTKSDQQAPMRKETQTVLVEAFDWASRHRNVTASDVSGISIADQFQFSGGGLPVEVSGL